MSSFEQRKTGDFLERPFVCSARKTLPTQDERKIKEKKGNENNLIGTRRFPHLVERDRFFFIEKITVD